MMIKNKQFCVECAAVTVSVVALIVSFCGRGSKVGVLDNMRLLKEAAPFQTIMAEETKYLNAMQARQDEEQKVLQAELNALEAKIKNSGKNKTAFKSEIDALQEKIVAFNRKYQVQKELVGRASAMARQQVAPVLNEVMNEMGRQGYHVILPKNVVNFSTDCVDVTPKIIEKLNKKDLTIAFPDPAQFLVAAPVETKVPTAAQN